MPVSAIFVEGELDVEIWQAILAGQPLVERGGSKYSLRPQVIREREKNKLTPVYIRDRDFDSDPPDTDNTPVVDASYEGTPIGWRWCRLEIENYLLEPALVERATTWPRDAFSEVLRYAATRIRDYQIARWVVGAVRRNLPPHHELPTRPPESHRQEFFLPNDLSANSVQDWARNLIIDFRTRVSEPLLDESINGSFSEYQEKLSPSTMGDVRTILKWWSGKDLLKALPWPTQELSSPGIFRNRIRDWIRGNPNEAIALLPEWQTLRNMLRLP